LSHNAFQCPYCGSADIRRSRKHGLGETPKMLLGVYPFRCLTCQERFFANIWLLSTRGYTKCPKCLRMDVVPWVKPEVRLTLWDRLRMSWGAHSYRCHPCRHFFISFRPVEATVRPKDANDPIN
jgi:DNA-directed RNA polymerase subunit RPC12/RpoP